jgi:ABC-type polysaccharide/polyol phosphate export permease
MGVVYIFMIAANVFIWSLCAYRTNGPSKAAFVAAAMFAFMWFVTAIQVGCHIL